MKKKNNKFKNMVELQLRSDEILQFLDFLKVAESGGLHCSSATKIKGQLHEFVVARIEGRSPNAYVVSTDDLVALMDQKSLQKLAFSKPEKSGTADIAERLKGISPQEASSFVSTDTIRDAAKKRGLEFVEKISDSKLEEVFNETVQEMTGQSK